MEIHMGWKKASGTTDASIEVKGHTGSGNHISHHGKINCLSIGRQHGGTNSSRHFIIKSDHHTSSVESTNNHHSA
jgi:hypothetical protein